jgi:hypothetical protein
MTKELRRLSILMLVMFLALFGATSWIQIVQAEALSANSANKRALYDSYEVQRGSIIASGSAIATSVPTTDLYSWQRVYTDADMWAPVTGFFNPVLGSRTGIEQALNPVLSGTGGSQFFSRIERIISGQPPRGSNVVLSLDATAQRAAYEALGDLPPRWFDEGYARVAANEVGRDAILGAHVALLFRGMPSLDSLDEGFAGGSLRAEGTYALAYRAVAELAARDPERGLTLFFRYWKETGRFDNAIRAAYGLTQPQFEEIWRKRTRRRYGGLALVADLSIASALTLFLVMPCYAIRRRRDRLRMAALVRADQEAERREVANAIEALLRSIPWPMPGGNDSPPPSPPPDEAPGAPREPEPG